ncbi:MAG: hypothetical protein KDD06_22285, partial [Phaeodactylibacter sp.]|nr:hypothetical protein [Phaeodactylibacter sp.]
DGNLVLYGPSGAVWASGTNSRCNRLAFQPDGNLVIYNNYTAVWASSTADSQHGGNGGRLLLLTADGWFSILDNYWQSVWGFDAQP